MKVNCLGCGFKVDLDDAYDDYEGPVKCFACETTLEIRAEQGGLKAVKQANLALHSPHLKLRAAADVSTKKAA